MIKVNKNSLSALLLIGALAIIAGYSLGTAGVKKTVGKTIAVNHPLIEKRLTTHAVNRNTTKWQVPSASYRLVIKATKPELPGYIELSRLCLPETITNGIDIRNAAGKKLPFTRFPDAGILIAAAPKDSLRYIYFGFAKPLSPPPAPPKSTDGARLKLTVIHARLNYLSGDKWIKDQQQRIIKRDKRRKKYYFKTVNEYLERGILPRINFAVAQCCWWDPQLSEQLLAVDTFQQCYLSWRPPNSDFIDLRKLRKYNILLFYSLSRYAGTIEWRIRALRNIPASEKKQFAKLPERVEDAPLKAFRKLFDPKRQHWQRRVRGTKAVTKINLERRPFDSRRNFGAIFSGKLVIKVAGEYQFAINSTSSTMLKLDGKNIFTWLGAHNPATGWGRTVKVPLTVGLHELKFLYHKASGFTHATLAWRSPGEKRFKLMNENDFAPGWINEPLACNAADGKKYPLIQRTARQLFFIDKRQRATWTNFTLLTGNAQNFIWEFSSHPKRVTTATMGNNPVKRDKTIAPPNVSVVNNHYKRFNGRAMDVVFNSACDEEVMINDKTGNFTTLHLTPLPQSEKIGSVNPDVRLKLWIPTFIYDDELLDGQVEISSSLSAKITCTLVIEASRANSILPSESKKFIIPAKPPTEQYKFAANSIIKMPFKLNGQELKNALAVTLTLQLPGMVFDQQKIRFIPLKELPELQFNGEYLTDMNNARVIPILHRPTLSELRRWELPLIMQQQLLGITHIMLLADDFGLHNNTFFNMVKNSFAQHDMQVDFIPWHKPSSGFTMLSSLPALLPAINKITSDTVVLIPPNSDVNGITSVRVQGRTIAALLERLRNNPHIRKIYLTMPFLGPSKIDANEQQFRKTLQQLCRTYNIYFIDLSRKLRSRAAWHNAYRIDPQNPALIASYPIQLTKQCAGILSKNLVK